MIPKNLSDHDIVKLRARARKMLDLQGLKWSQREIAGALNVSRALVVKTLAKVEAAKEGSLYWELNP